MSYKHTVRCILFYVVDRGSATLALDCLAALCLSIGGNSLAYYAISIVPVGVPRQLIEDGTPQYTEERKNVQ